MLYGLQYAAKIIYNVEYDNKRTIFIRFDTLYLWKWSVQSIWNKMT